MLISRAGVIVICNSNDYIFQSNSNSNSKMQYNCITFILHFEFGGSLKKGFLTQSYLSTDKERMYPNWLVINMAIYALFNVLPHKGRGKLSSLVHQVVSVLNITSTDHTCHASWLCLMC